LDLERKNDPYIINFKIIHGGQSSHPLNAKWRTHERRVGGK
jgi:hypothetical protein